MSLISSLWHSELLKRFAYHLAGAGVGIGMLRVGGIPLIENTK